MSIPKPSGDSTAAHRFIPVRHQTKKLYGVCDLLRRNIVKFHFRESQTDFLYFCKEYPEEIDWQVANLDSVYFIEPTKEWIGENPEAAAMFDEMLSTKP